MTAHFEAFTRRLTSAAPRLVRRSLIERWGSGLLAAGALAIVAGCSGDAGEVGRGVDEAGSRTSAAPHGLTQELVELVFEAPRVDLGSAWEGEVLPARFRGRVTGGDLTLIAISPDCGCATPELSIVTESGALEPATTHQLLPQGSELELVVHYDTQGRPGKHPRKVKLFGNLAASDGSSRDGIAVVEFTAEVRPWLVSEPALADLGRVRASDSRTATFRLHAIDDSPVRLEAVGSLNPDGITTKLTPVDPDADGRATEWTFDVSTDRNLVRGKHLFGFPIASDRERPDSTTDDPKTFRTTCNLRVEGAGLLALSPSVINLGTLEADTTVSRRVQLGVHKPGLRLKKKPVAKIVAATSEDLVRLRAQGGALPLSKTVTITPLPVPGQPAWDLEILVRGLDPEVPQNFAAFLEVETGFEAEPVLRAVIQGVRAK